MTCIFCKIVAGDLPAKIMYRDDQVVVFDDIHPKARHHKLIIPCKHIATLNDLTRADSDLISHMFFIAQQSAHDLNIAQSGYRLLFNCNRGGGQEIFHIHLHLMSGK